MPGITVVTAGCETMNRSARSGSVVAARALGCAILPSDLVGDRRAHDVRYVPAHARAVARNLARRARERVIPPR